MPSTKRQHPVQPGLIIKEGLEEFGQASISDLHRIYKQRIQRENGLRSKSEKLKGMVYSSFRTFVTRAKLSGLIEPVGEAPLLYPPRLKSPENPFLAIRNHKVVQGTRRLYSLTSKGKAEIEAWYNLQAFYP